MIRILALLTLILGIGSVILLRNNRVSDLAKQFVNPPIHTRPFVWWHWMGSNFSKTGITRDLEAMKSEGIGGATIFNLRSNQERMENTPWPEQTYQSPAYWDAIKHAATEAKRLGLEIGLCNTAGFSCTGGPWIDEERSMQILVWSKSPVYGGGKITVTLPRPKLLIRTGKFYRDIAVLAVPDKDNIGLDDPKDLTAKIDTSGNLSWDAPAGKWLIYRFGYASKGKGPHPLPEDLEGKALEADKLSTGQTRYHWNHLISPLKQHLGQYLGDSFTHLTIDSYEAGAQNWTPGFRQEFIKRKGYDPVPWLVSFVEPITNDSKNLLRRVVGTQEQSDRFDYDYKDVVSRLFYDNGWAVAKEMLNKAGLKLHHEPYSGQTPFNTIEAAALADLPMGEFWTNHWQRHGTINSMVAASARAAGKTIVGGEAFTGQPEESQYTEDPAMLKYFADGGFCNGINKLMLHTWTHQPFDDKYQPGMSMGQWGTHFGRHQTWFEPGKAFFSYLGRCLYLLQQGEQVTDYLCLDKPLGLSDAISTFDFLKDDIQIKDGKIKLPSGRQYLFMVFPEDGRMLPEVYINGISEGSGTDITTIPTVFPDTGRMSPEVARKIKKLVAAGAVVVSSKPTRSPSLMNFPACDDTVKSIGNEVWGNGLQNNFGKGFVFRKFEDAIRRTALSPDFFIKGDTTADKSNIVHRHSGTADIYFIVNRTKDHKTLTVSFRIGGMLPELWQAEDGSMIDAPVWQAANGRTEVELDLKGEQSVFVVFRKETSLKGESNKMEFKTVSETVVTGEWDVSFLPKLDSPFQIKFPELIDLSKHKSKRLNYFSGTATYHKKLNIGPEMVGKGKRLELLLGELNDIAEIKLNGKEVGVLWYPPYQVDITKFIRAGENELAVAVTNNWANRLIGDEQEERDFNVKHAGKGFYLTRFPEWFINDRPRPSSGRKTFSIWYYYTRDSRLQPAGLVGPVKLKSETQEIKY